MSVVLVDGFDVYNGTGANTGLQSKWIVTGTASVSLQTGRFSGQALRCTDGGTQSNPRRNLTAATSNVGVGFAAKAVTFPTANVVSANLVSFLSTSTFTFGLRCNTLGGLEVYRLTSGSAGTSLGTSANGVIVVGTWHYIEVAVSINDVSGTVVVKVDGVTVINLSSQDTNNAVSTVNVIQLGKTDNPSSNNGTFDFDDLYVTDTASTQGERRVETLYPTSDVAQGWTRSTGATNYTLVDEATVNGDTDYVQASSTGTVDTYGFQDLTGSPAVIDAVQVTTFAEKTDATTRAIALQIISGATTSDGSDFNLSASYGKFERLILLNPDGSVSWTYLTVNALTGGPKVTI